MSSTEAGSVEAALSYVDANAAELGVTRADVADLLVTSSYTSSHDGVTHVNLNQRFQGLEVFGGRADHGPPRLAADEGRAAPRLAARDRRLLGRVSLERDGDAGTGELLNADDWTSEDSRAGLESRLARSGAAAASGSSLALSSPNPVLDGSSYRVFALPKVEQHHPRRPVRLRLRRRVGQLPR